MHNFLSIWGRLLGQTRTLPFKISAYGPANNPILLPTKQPRMNLLILHVHQQQVKHSGITVTLSTIWEKFGYLEEDRL